MPSFSTLRNHMKPFSKKIGKNSAVASRIRPFVRNLGEKRIRARLRGTWRNRGEILGQYVPIFDWGRKYHTGLLSGDVMAGMVVAIMLMPQSMAYAMLAGLPPQIGLYTAVLPLVLYALFGSSRTLGVGPVAIVSLMVAHSLSPMASFGSPEYVGLALLLAFLSGVILILAGFLRLGFLTNFIGHPVIAGFTSAAALIIAFSQFKYVLGVDLERSPRIDHIILQAIEQSDKINPTTLLISMLGILLMISRLPLRNKLRSWGLSEAVSVALAKGMALMLVIFSILYVWYFDLNTTAGVEVVGHIPAGLPAVTLPSMNLDLWEQLFPAAILISVVGLVESLSVAKALATRKRQRIHPNQELIGLGAANLGAAFSGGYPVTGSFSRSVVNFTSGANTQLAAIITAVLIAIVLLLFTPALFFLPKAILAVIIIVAVTTLVDFGPLISAWNYYKPDGLAYAVTFLMVLFYGVEIGILTGIALSIGMYLWRTSRPSMPVLGRVGTTEHFRSVARYKSTTYKNLLIIRVDENLFFANAAYLEERMLAEIADRPDVKHLVLMMNTVSLIDASALETLEHLVESYRDIGVLIHLAAVKGPVMDMLERAHFLKHLSPGEVFLSPHEAVLELAGEVSEEEEEEPEEKPGPKLAASAGE